MKGIETLVYQSSIEKPSATTGEHISSFLTPEQAATFLGDIDPRTITKWARKGYLPAYPIGEGKRRLWRFLKRDLQSWLLSRRTVRFDFETVGDTLAPSHRCSPQKGGIQ
jgi:excisionase family DNA binding protein